jgi:hypothetical protein
MGAMTTLKRATASVLMGARWLLRHVARGARWELSAVATVLVTLGECVLDSIRWLLLAVGTAAVTLAAEAKDTAERLRR